MGTGSEAVLTLTSLEDGSEQTALKECEFITPQKTEGNALLLQYRKDGENRWAALNLTDGSLEQCPFYAGYGIEEYRSGIWGSAVGEGESFRLVFGWDEDPFVVPPEHSNLYLTDGPAPLFECCGENGYRIYRKDGSLFAETFPEQEIFSLRWIPERNGYLCTARDENGSGRLVFWDVSGAPEADRLELIRESEYD